VTSGNFLEQFDFFLFGFYATYIARTFFPAESEFAALMLTFAVFGSGFLMRPIGAVVLGAYIDRIGRRKGLMVTLAIMGCGTLLIALVPGYQTIGVLAPILVLVGRCCRGSRRASSLAGCRSICRKSPRRAIKASIPAGSPPASRWLSSWRR
jgi:MHS family citrate/tricarballylate:H+ symporter-like MFS transporter